jgi:exopolysaccharide biosynthesis WecB/TagA/CpsF family protein
MRDLGKFNVLGVQVNAIDYEAAVERVIAAAKAQEPLALSALAVHGVMTGVLEPEQGYRLNHLDVVVPDGQPVRWALNWLYHVNLKDRVYGPTLMLKVCEQAAQEQIPIFLYGSKPEVLEALEDNLTCKFPNLKIAGTQPSLFRQVSADESRKIARYIRQSGAGIVLVGLGCPRQEVWVFENRELLGIPAIAVGAAFDFHAGLLPQAPAWMQKRGLEWAFRLGQEPGRLWRRYVLLNPQYLFLLALQVLRIRQFNQPRPEPQKAMRYG